MLLRYLERSSRNRAKNRHFRDLPMQDHTSSASLENAIALQKFGVGQPVRRKEDDTLVRGKGKYTDDFTLPGLLHGVTVRSPMARGRIRKVHFGDKIPWKEFTIVTAADIPGKNRIELILADQPCLAEGMVNHVEEPISLLAHHDKLLLEEARRAITFDIEPLPVIFDPEQALQKSALQLLVFAQQHHQGARTKHSFLCRFQRCLQIRDALFQLQPAGKRQQIGDQHSQPFRRIFAWRLVCQGRRCHRRPSFEKNDVGAPSTAIRNTLHREICTPMRSLAGIWLS